MNREVNIIREYSSTPREEPLMTKKGKQGKEGGRGRKVLTCKERHPWSREKKRGRGGRVW